jgi:hypothetical protein
MPPKSGNRFSDKVMLNQKNKAGGWSNALDQTLAFRLNPGEIPAYPVG